MNGFSPEGRRQIAALLGVAPDASGRTILAAMDAALEECANPAPTPAAAPAAVSPGAAPGVVSGGTGDVLAWAVDTGRISASRAEFWTGQLAAERARTGSTVETEATMHSMSPVYADTTGRRPVAAESDTPLLDAFDRAVDGPSLAERERAEDLAAERALAASLERDREQASDTLTADEERALFGP